MSVTITGPDGVERDSLVFSTTASRRFLSGVIPEDTVDVQISINGAGFSSDPALASWSDGAFTVPNPTVEPDGLYLLNGSNTVAIRATLSTGSVTPTAIATVYKISDEESAFTPPTNISVEQKNAAVVVYAQPSSTLSFRGINVYASTEAGGGASGYTQINLTLVADGETLEEESSISDFEVEGDIAVDNNDTPLADPLYVKLTATQVDEDDVELSDDLNESYEVPETARRYRLTGSLVVLSEYTRYAFQHSRTAGPSSTPATVRSSSFAALTDDTLLYYVCTAVYYDSTTATEFETGYSVEVVGRPITVTPTLSSLPTVSRQEIVQQWITAVLRTNPQLKVEAGSVLRDTTVDPFAQESLRLRFIEDFFNRAKTPALLLQVDDPTSSGVSVPVNQSPYKQALQQALYLTSSTAVQNLIDSAFEGYAAGFGLLRRAGTASRGEVTFYTTRRPTSTILIPLGTVVGGGGVQFVTTKEAAIDIARLASFYDPSTGRWSVTVAIRCTTLGTAGNLGAGQIRSVVGAGAGQVSVINSAAVLPGKDLESNLALTRRALDTIASVDTGTTQGYNRVIADVSGVTDNSVVAAGNSYMQRDLDSAGVHRGGKVDLYVVGGNEITVTDTFAFSFELAKGVQFVLVGDPDDLIFKAIDPALSSSNPILELLADENAGFGMLNASTGDYFDLTDVTVVAFNSIRLSPDVVQPAVSLSDVVLGSYRRRASNNFVFLRQPVTAALAVEGSVTGELPSSAFSLVHPSDPLAFGQSTLAGDYLSITSYTDDSGALQPSGDPISVSDEAHVLVGEYPEFLDNLGANYLTVVVTDSTGAVTYKGPNDPSEDPDYTITIGSETTALSITRVPTGNIASGQTVLVSYEHDENFTVSYKTNLIVSQGQDAVDAAKHTTADVLVKSAVAIPLDISATVVLNRGAVRSTVDAALVAALDNFFANQTLGAPVRQSVIVALIEGVPGVSYVVVPLTLMAPSADAVIVREPISTDTAQESVVLTALSTSAATVYLLKNALPYDTADGGGTANAFRGVFQDDVAMALLASDATLTSLGVSVNRVYIIGATGKSIAGYSDDATLIAAGYTTSAQIEDRRVALTANRVLVSVAVGDSPISHSYAVTYSCVAGSGPQDVDPGDVQYVTAGEYLLTYDEDR